MSRKASLVTTRTGVTIGLTHVRHRPLHSISADEERLQTALITKPKRVDWASVIGALFTLFFASLALYIGAR